MARVGGFATRPLKVGFGEKTSKAVDRPVHWSQSVRRPPSSAMLMAEE